MLYIIYAVVGSLICPECHENEYSGKMLGKFKGYSLALILSLKSQAKFVFLKNTLVKQN